MYVEKPFHEKTKSSGKTKTTVWSLLAFIQKQSKWKYNNSNNTSHLHTSRYQEIKMAKRRNDGNQESKEEYEARERREEMERGGDGDTVGGGGFSRASQETLKTRRIIRVSASSKWKNRSKTANSNPIATPAEAAPSGNGNGNVVIPSAISTTGATERL